MARQGVIEKRREKVKIMMLNDVSIADMSKQLEWSTGTIWNDILWIRDFYRKSELTDEQDPVVMYLMKNAEQYRQAAKIMRDSTEERVKLIALRLMKDLEDAKIEKCQQFGIAPKVAEKYEIKSVNLNWDMKLIKEMKGDGDAENH